MLGGKSRVRPGRPLGGHLLGSGRTHRSALHDREQREKKGWQEPPQVAILSSLLLATQDMPKRQKTGDIVLNVVDPNLER